MMRKKVNLIYECLIFTFDHHFLGFSICLDCRSWLEYRGNVIGATMYRTGRPGQTMCINEGLATSRRYPGLCGVYIERAVI